MTSSPSLLHVAERLAGVPGVVAVVLGGSRATGTHRESSDWDFGLYYEGTLDTAPLRALGYEGQVFEPGEWSALMNGGAWFVIDGVKVDVIYREVGAIAHWIDEASAGRFKVELLNGYLAGFPTTVLVGEVAVAKVLHGALPFSVPSYPAALRASAPPHWRGRRDFHLMYADMHDERGDAVMAAAVRARAAIEEAHAVMAERGEWVLNEKGLLARAGL
jgi:hypothetical protein